MAILPRQYPALNQPGISPELRTALRQLANRTYDLRDAAANADVDAETPSGPLDGINKTFYLAFPPIPASLQIFHNGLLLLANGLDYVLTGKLVIYTTAPAMADWHRAYYRRSLETNG